MKKLKGKWAVKQVLKKLLHPRKFLRFLKLTKKGKRLGRAYDDAQLTLYSKMLPSGFLHYGYFEDPDTAPEKISFHDIEQAQLLYAELITAQIVDKESPVLDCGCGMGGLIELLLQKKFAPVALTPDRVQIQQIRKKFPDVPLIEGKFEAMPVADYRGFFGTVITSESLQYLQLDGALPVMAEILKPGGRWIACDYFRIGEASEKSGHQWDEFTHALSENGWEITDQQDITPNILPTMAYLDMLGARLGLPVFTFAIDKLKKKKPALSYLLEDVIGRLEEVVLDNLKTVHPETFAQKKKYMRLVIERT